MARCIDCLHFEACSTMYEAAFGRLPKNTGVAGRCETFKHKDSVIVPPRKIGETVYIVISKESRYCKSYAYVRKSKLTYKNMARVISDFGKTVFLSKEEAERVANGKQ